MRSESASTYRHLLATAFGWGGLPTYEVVYEASTTARPIADYQLTVGNVPVGGFWSISIYNKDGYFQENEFSSYSTNNVIAEWNVDGSVTINFGERNNGRKNFLFIMDGWSYVDRLYQPHQVVLNDDWHFPEPDLVTGSR